MEINTLSPARIRLSGGVQPKLETPVFRQQLQSISAFAEGEERTAGSMPVWGAPQTISEEIAYTAQSAAKITQPENSFAQALRAENRSDSAEQPFGFGDIVDMVNPLQHIPLVNLAYRHVTGDEIRPIGKVIGGTVFAGPFGAASALADIGLQEGTGKDMAGHVFAIADDATATQTATQTTTAPLAFRADESQNNLADIQALPGSTLALADLGASRQRLQSGFTSFVLNG